MRIFHNASIPDLQRVADDSPQIPDLIAAGYVELPITMVLPATPPVGPAETPWWRLGLPDPAARRLLNASDRRSIENWPEPRV